MSECNLTYQQWFCRELDKHGHWQWNATGVDIMIDSNDPEVIIKQVVSFFQTIDAPLLKEGNIRVMFQQNDYTSFEHAVLSMFNYNEDHWFSCIGANGTKIYYGLKDKVQSIPLHVMMGATPFFGHSIGVRKLKKLEQVYGHNLLNINTEEQISSVEGFDTLSAKKVIHGLPRYNKFHSGIPGLHYSAMVSSDGVLSGKKFVFTGFRDKELKELAESEGGTEQSSVSSKTDILVAADPNSKSGKMQKARGLKITIMSIDEFRTLVEG